MQIMGLVHLSHQISYRDRVPKGLRKGQYCGMQHVLTTSTFYEASYHLLRVWSRALTRLWERLWR